MINIKTLTVFPLLLLFFSTLNLRHVQAQPSINGYPCSANQTTNRCQTYVFYRAAAPDFLNLSAIGDLFSVSRPMISKPSNISSPAAPLQPDQSLFIPIQCSCHTLNRNLSLSYAGLNYTIVSGDTFYRVSTVHFQNLTTYQSVMTVNPTFVPTQLNIDDVITFPIFCKCPNVTQLQDGVNYLISYVFQPSDDFTSIASRFGTTVQSIIDANGRNIQLLDTVFVPVSRLPNISQPTVTFPVPVGNDSSDGNGAEIGLGVGLGICVLALLLVCAAWFYRERRMKEKRAVMFADEEKPATAKSGKRFLKPEETNLLAEVDGCLDKYRVFGIDDLRDATEDFDEKCLIKGSVYRGSIDGEVFAIKKMKWNAYQELKILQKVNHGNLVKLEGFCIDHDESNCFLVYEYVEIGSLDVWLHEKKNDKLSWKTRIKVAIDVANGLQYIHEHTRPRVVHKDIKSSNILLDLNMRAKIANFGLAKSGCNAITMHIVGTQGYIAPEYIADGVVSTKMDVFAFGVVLLELISGREAVDEEGRVLWASAGGILDGEEESNVIKMKEWMEHGLLDETSSMQSVMSVMGVAVACLSKDPAKRPSMVEIVYALSKSDDSLSDFSEDGLSPRQVVAR